MSIYICDDGAGECAVKVDGVDVNIYVMMGLESVWQKWMALKVNIYARGWG